jgi:hypothetical protein
MFAARVLPAEVRTERQAAVMSGRPMPRADGAGEALKRMLDRKEQVVDLTGPQKAHCAWFAAA